MNDKRQNSTNTSNEDWESDKIRKTIAYQTIILISIVKWVFLGSVVGGLVGLLTTGFLKVIHYIPHITKEYKVSVYFLPVTLFALTLLHYYFPETEGIGTNRLIRAIHHKFGRIKVVTIPLRVIYSFLILLTGGSAGKESPCAQIGAGVSSGVADLFKLDNIDHKKLVICGVCAGFATVFGTPIAGAMFGVEILILGTISYEYLLPAFISTITACQVSSHFGITYFYHPLDFVPIFNESFFLSVIGAGIFFGICSHLYVSLLDIPKLILKKIPLWLPLKSLMVGVILLGFTFIFSKEYLGLGLQTITDSLNGKTFPWYSFVIKAVFTALTLSVTSNSSVITPIFFIGATAGSTFAAAFGLDPGTFAALGFVSLLAGCANTPVSTSIMAVEMFGTSIAPYAVTSCVISFLMTGHKSIYSSQILSFSKSRSIRVEVGKELADAEFQLELRNKTVGWFVIKYIRILWKRIKDL
jgi:H+/Cl- antiporter ClcA